MFTQVQAHAAALEAGAVRALLAEAIAWGVHGSAFRRGA